LALPVRIFAKYNQVATTVNLTGNQIGDISSKALAGNLILQTITANNSGLTAVSYQALHEKTHV
jgi:uncharacterized protein YvpB